MLTVPETIKTLFRTDGVRKNFRVQFPDGELPDLTNSDVVTESVTFTESVMSQAVFTYGTAERSVIEFETVGISNMYGMKIFCGIEIDTTSLSAADLSAIAADPGDGTLVAAADSDLGWGVYRIPYGWFRVVSCPRNQENMAHRRVRAMSAAPDSPFEDVRMTALIPFRRFTIPLRRAAAAALGYWDPTVPERLMGYTATVWKSAAQNAAAEVTGTSTKAAYLGETLYTIAITSTTVTYQPLPTNMLRVDLTGKWADRTLFDKFSGDVAALGLELNTYPGQTQEAALAELMRRFCSDVYVGGYSNYTPNPNDTFAFPADGSFVADPRIISSWDSENQNAGITLRHNVSYTISTGGTVVASGDDNGGTGHSAVIYELTYSGSDPGGSLRLTESYKTTAPGEASYQHIGSYDPVAVASGWAELNGWVVRPSRGKKMEVLALSSAAPAAVGPGDTESLWWDEYDILPVGAVLYQAGTPGSLKKYKLTSGSSAKPMGGSVYDLRANEIPQTMTAPSKTNVLALINTYFLPGTGSLGFTPAELTMRAWPWIEAGDALAVTTAGGDTVNTFVLRQTIRGIQLLMADIEAPGGEVMED